VGRFARAAAVAFPATALPRAVVTGAPVRPEIVAAAHPDDTVRADARRQLGLPVDRFVVGVVGGSLGSKTINTAALALADLWVERGDIALYHVVGRRDMAWVGEGPVPGGEGLVYRQVAYEERMALFYQAADVVVSRAGASTVSELAVVGTPAVLVPLPGAPGDHQTANATVLVRAGGAVLVPDDQCTGERLSTELDDLRSDPGRLDHMRAGALALGRPDAVRAVVEVVESHARSGPRPGHSPDAGTRARHGVREES
jgi:UDP-N-acetylglucosamine:LPS N-acetylglucosamine transferase